MSVKNGLVEDNQPRWLNMEPDGLVLLVHAQPGAKRSEVVGPFGDALKIRLAAPPIEGRANEELIRFLAVLLGATKRQVEIVSGPGSRRKRVRVSGVSPRLDVIRRLDVSG